MTLDPSAEDVYVFPASFAQQRLWFLDQFEPGSPLYNIFSAVRMQGALHMTALEQSLQEVVQRHEALRTTLVAIDGTPAQVINPCMHIPLAKVDLQELSRTDQEAETVRLASEAAQQPFHLAHGPLLRTTLLKLGEEEHVLLLSMHHIISDGWSMGVFIREIALLYEAFSQGRPSPLPGLPIQYADFAAWQREWLQGNVLQEQRTYWKQQLGDHPPVLRLPTDRPRPAVQTSHGARQAAVLPLHLSEALKALSRQENATLFMTLLAAFNVLLCRYTHQADISVGTSIANRTRAETEGLIGFFVNTLVLRTDLSGDPGFCELVQRVRDVALGAYAHQDLPFEQLVEELNPVRDTSHTPLFQVMFTLQNAPMQPLELSGLTLSPLGVDRRTAKFDLLLSMLDTEQGLVASLEYNTDLFNDPTITRMLGHFRTLLEGIVANPEQRLSSLPLISAAELQQLLVEWNNTALDYPREQCFHQLFAQRVECTPDSIAVVFADQQLTYAELNARANQLAHHLQTLGVGPEVLVAICVERSLEMVIGLLGILKAGGAYLPLDPAYPKERLAFMLEDARALVLLTQHRFSGSLPESRTHLICLDTDWQAMAEESVENPTSGATAHNLAYVIYTSGSTGQPKGTMIPHQGLVNYLNWCVQVYLTERGRGAPVHSPIGFDLTITGLFSPLLVGQSIVLLPETQEIESLCTLLRTEGNFSLVKLTPAHLEVLSHLLPPEVARGRTGAFIIGGEALWGANLAFWQTYTPHTRLINEYGPTETVVGCCVYEVPAGISPASAVPIGRPIYNTQLYILDSHLQPTPVGVPGELYIGGDGLARGYLNRSELTAERFIPHPVSAAMGARLYKTGDLACYQPDGNITFLGRIDDQVKIRGFRIELGEVEAILSQHPAVHEAIVMVREETSGDRRLVAYVVPRPEQPPTVSTLRRFLREKLPEYMVPAAFVLLEQLPLTRNGKVDRRALPKPERQGAFVAPRSPVEERLAGMWAEVLGLERVGIHDNFFELGGHSLLATQVISRLRDAFRVELPVRRLFDEGATVAGLAELLETIRWAAQGLQDTPCTAESDREEGEL
jgi:amino acid adenylation domain-containing protein